MTVVTKSDVHARVVAPPALPRAYLPRAAFDTLEAERWRARAERASYDQLNSVETSRLLKNVSRMLYCALVDAAQRARVRLASVIALDRISQRLRHFDQETDVEGMLAETVASVTLMANANDTDDPIETRSRIEDVTRAPLSIDQLRSAYLAVEKTATQQTARS